MQVLLLDDLLVLLQRQEERLVLRCHSRALAPAPDGKQMLSPVIRLRSAMTREVATGAGRRVLGGSPRVLGCSPRFEGVQFGLGEPGSVWARWQHSGLVLGPAGLLECVGVVFGDLEVLLGGLGVVFGVQGLLLAFRG